MNINLYLSLFMNLITGGWINLNMNRINQLTKNSIDDKISTNDKNLIILKNNTENIIEYIGEKNNENEKEFKFWELLKKN